jgi:hypothetical protein
VKTFLGLRIEGVFDALLEHELVVSEFFFQPVSFEQADSVFTDEGAAKFERRKTAHLLPAGFSPAPFNVAARVCLPDFVFIVSPALLS